MNNATLPMILEPAVLAEKLNLDNIRIVDLCKTDVYRQAHVPGAVHLEYNKILRQEKPALALLPTEQDLSEVLSSLGISPQTHVIAYDDEGGGKACRLLWTLSVIGHHHFSLLDGGLHAWVNEDHPVDNKPVTVAPADYKVSFAMSASTLADKDYVLNHLDNDNISLLDSRSPQEFNGKTPRAEKGGHIPHAVNMDWTLAMDQKNNFRLKQKDELGPMLDKLGVTHDKEVIVYCHSHHRSAHTFIMLKSLGFQNVKAYPGSWSEWGNLPDTPTEM